MTRTVLLISALLIASYCFGQQACDSVLQADKALLQNFWLTFKDAVNNKNKAKIESLCHFPFTCDYCISASGQRGNKPYIKVTKATFDKAQYQIFFTDKLIEEISKYNLPQDLLIFKPHASTDGKKCFYSFGYVARNEDAQHPGMQHFFDLQKVNGQFKIISTWTVP